MLTVLSRITPLKAASRNLIPNIQKSRIISKFPQRATAREVTEIPFCKHNDSELQIAQLEQPESGLTLKAGRKRLVFSRHSCRLVHHKYGYVFFAAFDPQPKLIS
jgi:hypothetical protein